MNQLGSKKIFQYLSVQAVNMYKHVLVYIALGSKVVLLVTQYSTSSRLETQNSAFYFILNEQIKVYKQILTYPRLQCPSTFVNIVFDLQW